MDRATDHDDESRLAQIERELVADDPVLADALSTVSPMNRARWPWMALAVLGTVLLLIGSLIINAAMVLLGAGCALVGSLVVVAESPAAEQGSDRN